MVEYIIKVITYMILIFFSSLTLHKAIDRDGFDFNRCVSIILTIYFMAGTIKMIGVM